MIQVSKLGNNFRKNKDLIMGNEQENSRLAVPNLNRLSSDIKIPVNI